ncbi:MAG: hypothetical protein U1F43_37135 [Myxococcota bacterium]
MITAPDAGQAADSALAPDVEPVADSAVADASADAEDAVVDAVVADTAVADTVVADTVADVVVRDTVVRDAASDAAEPHVIRVMLTSKPSGAKVLSNHRVVGSTPYEVRWTSGGKAPTFELTARGYRAASVTLREKDAPTRHVVLQRLRPDFEPLEDEPHRGP